MTINVTADLHGEYGRFVSLLNKLSLKKGDHLYILGDAVDRGADGIKILQLIRAHKETITLLLGNHEYMMLNALSSGDFRQIQSWMLNGGKETMRSFLKLSVVEQQELLNWLRGLPLSARVTVGERNFYLIHGWPGESLYDVVWGRPDSLYSDPGIENATVIVGHTPVCLLANGTMSTERYLGRLEASGDHMRILHAPHFIDVDCGCGHDVSSARLACLRLDDMAEFYV